MALVSYSPWTDAAQYGAGLGQTLGQAMLQMPQQRYELAAQQFAQQQRQQIARQQLAQQQQEAQAQQGLGLGQLKLHQQELQQNEQMHQLELQEQRARTEALSKGTWKIQELGDGSPVLLNTTTGELKPFNVGQQSQGGLGAFGGRPMTGGQAAENVHRSITDYAGALGSPLTNNPAIMNLLSNRAMQALSPQAIQSGLGAAPTNAAPVAPRPLRFNPATGGLE